MTRTECTHSLANDGLPEETLQKLIPLAQELAPANCRHCEPVRVDTMLVHVMRETLCPALRQSGLDPLAQELESAISRVPQDNLGNLTREFRERIISLTREAHQSTSPNSTMAGITEKAHTAALSAWEENGQPPEIYQAICAAHSVVEQAAPNHEQRLQAHTALIRDMIQACHHRSKESSP